LIFLAKTILRYIPAAISEWFLPLSFLIWCKVGKLNKNHILFDIFSDFAKISVVNDSMLISNCNLSRQYNHPGICNMLNINGDIKFKKYLFVKNERYNSFVFLFWIQNFILYVLYFKILLIL